MDPQDDPEKRIRDLERPLADTARASEFGSAQSYPPPPSGPVPPPPPPTSYDYQSYGGYTGPSYSATPPKSSSSGRVFWILGGVVIVGILVVVGGIAAYVAHRISEVHIPTALPTATTGPSIYIGTLTNTPTPSRTRTRTPGSTASGTSQAPQGAPLTVSGINENQTIACNENAVTVNGITNTITITGHCKSLSVSGQGNLITIDAADSIEASGINNKVTYHSGSPQIKKSGINNNVDQG